MVAQSAATYIALNRTAILQLPLDDEFTWADVRDECDGVDWSMWCKITDNRSQGLLVEVGRCPDRGAGTFALQGHVRDYIKDKYGA